MHTCALHVLALLHQARDPFTTQLLPSLPPTKRATSVPSINFPRKEGKGKEISKNIFLRYIPLLFLERVDGIFIISHLECIPAREGVESRECGPALAFCPQRNPLLWLISSAVYNICVGRERSDRTRFLLFFFLQRESCWAGMCYAQGRGSWPFTSVQKTCLPSNFWGDILAEKSYALRISCKFVVLNMIFSEFSGFWRIECSFIKILNGRNFLF